jgi:hypothetical protein
MHVLWLEARGGIWNREPTGKLVAIERPGARFLNEYLEEPLGLRLHGHDTPIGLKPHRHAIATLCPEPESDTVRLDGRTLSQVAPSWSWPRPVHQLKHQKGAASHAIDMFGGKILRLLFLLLLRNVGVD